MPVKDNGGPFLAATVAIRSPLATEKEICGRPEWVADKIREVGALVHVAFAIPSESYGDVLQAKIASVDTLARANYLKDGRNARFWNPYGVPVGNFIWQNCMGASLAAILASAAFVGPIKQVQYPFGDPRLVGEGWLRAGSGHAEADLPGS